MKTFNVYVPFSGYVGGYYIVAVEAESEEEAIKNARYDGVTIDENIIRDDTDTHWNDASVDWGKVKWKIQKANLPL